MQQQLLLAIRGSGQGWLSVGQVAEELMLAPHSALGLVDRSVARGLVAREVDPDDHRRVRVSLLPCGRELITRLTLAHREELRRLWSRIPEPR